MIQLKDITKIYNKGAKNAFKAVNGVSLALPERGMVFLVGKSGCGKTTLLNIMGMLDSPDSGKLYYKGKTDFSEKQADEYRNRSIAILFQSLNLLPDFNVIENMALAREINREKLSAQEAAAILAQVDLQGYESRRISELSGGQKQRVAIARALTKSPEIILADEPTGALDENNSRIIFDILKQLSKDKLVVVITHDKDAALEYADRIISMSGGKIINDRQVGGDAAEPAEALLVAHSNTTLPVEQSKTDKGQASRLPAGTLMRLSFKKILRQKWRFMISVMLIVLAFSMFGVSSVFTNYDIGAVVAEGLREHGEQGVSIGLGDSLPPFGYVVRGNGYLLTNEDYLRISQSGHVGELDKFFRMTWTHMLFAPAFSERPLTTGEFQGMYETTEARLRYFGTGYYIRYGSFPVQVGRDGDGVIHAAITDHTANLIRLAEDGVPCVGSGVQLKGALAHELVGRVLEFGAERVKVTGIIGTDFHEFEDYIINRNFADLSPVTRNLLHLRLFGAFTYNSLYVARGTHENLYRDIKHAGGVIYFTDEYFFSVADSQAQARPFFPVSWVGGAEPHRQLARDEIILSEGMFFDFFGRRFDPQQTWYFNLRRNAFLGFTFDANVINAGRFRVAGVFRDLDSQFVRGGERNFHIVMSQEAFDYAANEIPFLLRLRAALPESAGAQTAFLNFLYSNIYFVFNPQNGMHNVGHGVYNTLTTYSRVFSYIAIVLAIAAVGLLADFMLSNIKDRTGEIGVLRAMGVRGLDISKMFLVQALCLLVIALVLSTAFIFGFTALFNGILYDGFVDRFPAEILEDLPLLMINATPFLITFSLLTGVLLASTILPTLRLIKMKPAKCIQKG